DGEQTSPTSPAIGPDGTVSLAWPRIADTGGAIPATEVALSRFAPGATTATSATLARSDDASAALPQLGAAPDGSLLATWVEADFALNFSFHGMHIAADGTRSAPARARDVPVTIFPIGPTPFLQTYVPQADALGGGLLGVVTGFAIPGMGGPSSVSTQIFDAAPPVVTADVPTSAVVGTPVSFATSVSDRVATELLWEFGDESESRSRAPRHRYAEVGTYAVTLTARDAAGNETVVRRQLTITPPPVQPGPPAPLPPAPRPAARASAALKLTTASRSGAKVTLAGTIARSASGRVTLVYTQKLGRRTIRATTTATIAKGHWSTTLRLGRALARAPRRGATVTVSYAGDADTLAASAKRAVSTPKAKRPQRKRR
ncbi:MAG TPA: PKD domain-containing protein, partial [Conexibacter sp.]|nr:PKD domain-containing protein [Conexibacter sp.]